MNMAGTGGRTMATTLPPLSSRQDITHGQALSAAVPSIAARNRITVRSSEGAPPPPQAEKAATKAAGAAVTVVRCHRIRRRRLPIREWPLPPLPPLPLPSRPHSNRRRLPTVGTPPSRSKDMGVEEPPGRRRHLPPQERRAVIPSSLHKPQQAARKEKMRMMIHHLLPHPPPPLRPLQQRRRLHRQQRARVLRRVATAMCAPSAKLIRSSVLRAASSSPAVAAGKWAMLRARRSARHSTLTAPFPRGSVRRKAATNRSMHSRAVKSICEEGTFADVMSPWNRSGQRGGGIAKTPLNPKQSAIIPKDSE
mmetsp:Transcript_1569/g.2264  ORF Transcript_1569/g.2264 Transcript_1569/m.2264 type:complete len:308 (-) Transcript_1569:142-1065(-)